MNINSLCTLTNKVYITSENLRNLELFSYMDLVIDDINDRLQANFPTISEWKDYVVSYNEAHALDPDFVPLDVDVYTAFPAKYLRNVVALGAAVNFYTNDEEGEQVASKFYIQYERNIFNMLRDYTELVPVEFQNNEGGYVTTTYNAQEHKDACVEGIVLEHDEYCNIL